MTGLGGPSFLLISVGVSGVLYPPKIFSKEVFNEKVFLKICPNADDIWLKSMALLNGIQHKKIMGYEGRLPTIPNTQSVGLWKRNLSEDVNDKYTKAVFTKYNLYSKLKD